MQQPYSKYVYCHYIDFQKKKWKHRIISNLPKVVLTVYADIFIPELIFSTISVSKKLTNTILRLGSMT